MTRNMLHLLKRALFASFNDGLFTIAKGAAYSSLLSFFPVLATFAAVLVETRADFVRRNVLAFLTQIVPPGTEEAVIQQFRSRGQRPHSILIVAAIIALWAGSSVIKSLIDGFNAAYRVPRNRSFLAHNGMGILLALLALVPLLGASSLILFGGAIEQGVMALIKGYSDLHPLAGWWELLWRAVRYLVAIGAVATLTAILYFYGPYRKQRWRDVWPGAILATFLWLGATAVFGWYVRHFTNYNVLYGSVGTSMALLIWMYLLAAIALFGCEFNAEAERHRMNQLPPGAKFGEHRAAVPEARREVLM